MKGRAYVGIIAVLVVIVLLVLAFFMPWWSYTATDSADDTTTSVSFKLNEVDITIESPLASATVTESYSNFTSDQEVPTVMRNTSWMLFASIGLAVATLILMLISMSNPKIKKFATIFALITAIMILVTAIYFMIAFPNALEADTTGLLTKFFGTKDVGTVSFTFAPTWAWFFVISVIPISLLAMIPICKTDKGTMACLTD